MEIKVTAWEVKLLKGVLLLVFSVLKQSKVFEQSLVCELDGLVRKLKRLGNFIIQFVPLFGKVLNLVGDQVVRNAYIKIFQLVFIFIGMVLLHNIELHDALNWGWDNGRLRVFSNDYFTSFCFLARYWQNRGLLYDFQIFRLESQMNVNLFYFVFVTVVCNWKF